MKVVIVEDSELVLGQLQRLLACISDVEVVGQAGDEDSAVSLILKYAPHAVLLDLHLASGSGIGVLQRIRAAGSPAQVIVLTNDASPAHHQICSHYDVAGFYDKTMEIQVCMQHMYDWADHPAALSRPQGGA